MAEEDDRGAAFKVKAPLEHPRKPIFGLREWYGRLCEKESDYHGCEQAHPDDTHSLFLVRFTDTITQA